MKCIQHFLCQITKYTLSCFSVQKQFLIETYTANWDEIQETEASNKVARLTSVYLATYPLFISLEEQGACFQMKLFIYPKSFSCPCTITFSRYLRPQEPVAGHP